jgi:hypothetical protein
MVVEAANSILGRLGDEMFAIIKEELEAYHGIKLDAGVSLSLDDLDSALQNLVGIGAARWLMLEIRAEIDYLSNEDIPIRNIVSIA